MPFRYIQCSAERDLSGSNYPNGVISYKKQLGPDQQVNLDKSFLRMRCKLQKPAVANGTQQLESINDIAPNYLMAYNLSRQMFHHINGTTVSEIRQYVPQVGALHHRIMYPQSYKDKFLATLILLKWSLMIDKMTLL